MRRTDAVTALVALTLLGGSGCASAPTGRVRFDNADPVWTVNDRRPMPPPAEREYLRNTMALETLLRRPVIDTLRVPEEPRALNVNALGEVPDSTWFTNRVGLTPGDVARGPGDGSGPDLSEPLRVLRSKKGGAQPGFLVEDIRGDRYILKFDHPLHPEMETGADVVVQRLLWAVGYHVPQDSVILFRREDLVVAEGATRKTPAGRKIPLTEADVDDTLAPVPKTDGGRWRGLVSKFLRGVPAGGYAMRGTRPDDPNDLVPHQHRRDLRGQWIFFAWLAHTDVKEDNGLDMWIEDPPGSGTGHLVHYLVDFGKGLGSKGLGVNNTQDTFGHQLDFRLFWKSLLSFGLWQRPWEESIRPDIEGVGRFDVEHLDPSHFRTSLPWTPFWRADRFDAFWAAKILMDLTPAHIAAAVDQGRYSDPRAREYLVRTLVGRQRKLGRYWFRRVNPLGRLQVERVEAGWRLCGTDLLLAHGLAQAGHDTRYDLTAWDRDGEPLGWRRTPEPTGDGRVCVDLPRPPGDVDGYTMIVWKTRRADGALPPTVIHLARRPRDGVLRVIGLYRR
ncbi:MAG: hypothetical protein ACQEXJ_19495 [Myxococcota bacterium]